MGRGIMVPLFLIFRYKILVISVLQVVVTLPMGKKYSLAITYKAEWAVLEV
jgi:hypothetical protein